MISGDIRLEFEASVSTLAKKLKPRNPRRFYLNPGVATKHNNV